MKRFVFCSLDFLIAYGIAALLAHYIGGDRTGYIAAMALWVAIRAYNK